jgi:hypothetical protein
LKSLVALKQVAYLSKSLLVKPTAIINCDLVDSRNLCKKSHNQAMSIKINKDLAWLDRLRFGNPQ